MRDGNNSQYFHGTSTYVDEDARPVKVTVKVDDANLMDMNKCAIPETGAIHIGVQDFKYDKWEYDGYDTYIGTPTALR